MLWTTALSPNSYLLWNFPPVFILKAELVDYFISLSQSLHLDNRSVIKLIQEAVMRVSSQSQAYIILRWQQETCLWKHKKKKVMTGAVANQFLSPGAVSQGSLGCQFAASFAVWNISDDVLRCSSKLSGMVQAAVEMKLVIWNNARS